MLAGNTTVTAMLVCAVEIIDDRRWMACCHGHARREEVGGVGLRKIQCFVLHGGEQGGSVSTSTRRLLRCGIAMQGFRD